MASKAFKDINLSFKRHPVTNDLVAIKNEDAIKKSVKNIIFTIVGEKPFNPEFGSQISGALFELDTQFNQIAIIVQTTRDCCDMSNAIWLLSTWLLIAKDKA